MKTIFAIFDSYDATKSAVDALLDGDFSPAELNVLVQVETAREQSGIDSRVADVKATEGIGEKSLRGLNGLIAGEQPVVIPDVGEVLAGGELATMLARTAAAPGEVDGGLQKALIDFSLAEGAAKKYRAQVEMGDLLVIVRAPDDRAQEAADVLQNAGGSHFSSAP